MRGGARVRASSTATVDPVVSDSDHTAHEDELRAELQAALEREPRPTDERLTVAIDALPYATDEDDAPEAEEETESDKGRRRLQSSLEWVAVVIGALVVALVVKTFLFQAFYIPSASMEPTLEKGDRVLVNKISYDLHDVNRGDVIVFELDPEDVGPDGIKDLIKRVVGLPGDVIESRDGVVYVNDRALEEPYLADGTITGDPNDSRNPAIERQTVPDGHVFVLGDNRSNSADSRYPYRGPISIDTIVGRAFVLVWPPGDIGNL
jgi:signal peptidase I